jgi:hypothetical protein
VSLFYCHFIIIVIVIAAAEASAGDESMSPLLLMSHCFATVQQTWHRPQKTSVLEVKMQ